jgi:hypothetical protein
MNCAEAQELITALVDNELDDIERFSIEAHLKECAACRLAFEEERALKEQLRAAGAHARAGGELRNKILSDPRIFPQRSRPPTWWREHIWPAPLGWRRALGGALMIALVLSTFYFFSDKKEPIAVAALETYGLVLKGDLPIRRPANPDEIAAQLTRAVDGRFHPMGYDFSAMDLRPVAGLVREIQGRKVLVAIYQGGGGAILCYTFLGAENDAPPNAGRFFDPEKKINFYVFSRAEVNAVLHREGEVICVLASALPMDQLLALAKSKARPS